MLKLVQTISERCWCLPSLWRRGRVGIATSGQAEGEKDDWSTPKVSSLVVEVCWCCWNNVEIGNWQEIGCYWEKGSLSSETKFKRKNRVFTSKGEHSLIWSIDASLVCGYQGFPCTSYWQNSNPGMKRINPKKMKTTQILNSWPGLDTVEPLVI